jgi:hypothetical protein
MIYECFRLMLKKVVPANGHVQYTLGRTGGYLTTVYRGLTRVSAGLDQTFLKQPT